MKTILLKPKMVFTSLVLTIVLSLFLIVHQTQGAATMSASASAGAWSSSAEAVPGISGVNSYERFEGYSGTGTAYADVMGDTESTVDQGISAWCDEVTYGFTTESGFSIEYTEKFVAVSKANKTNYGMPYDDKWASAHGTCDDAYDDAYDDYDCSWW